MTPDYDAVLTIATYRRTEILRRTLAQLREEQTRYRVQILVLNDGNPRPDMDPVIRENPDVLFLHNAINNGKHRYWTTVSTLLQEASRFRYNFLIQMDDDHQPVDDFLDTIIEYLYRLEPDTILKFITNENSPDWGTPHWVDGGAAYPRSFLDQIGHTIDEVPLQRWADEPQASSGVWHQVTRKLNALNYKVEFVDPSMANHLGYRDSVMNAALRRKHELRTLNFSKKWPGSSASRPAIMEGMSIDALARRTVLVVGDVMLDRFIDGVVDRMSQEAPVPVLRTEDERNFLGGAGNVASNVAALNGRAILVGAIGQDAAGAHISQTLCPGAGIDARLTTAGGYPTCQKTRFLCEGRQLIRVDSEKTVVDGETLNRIDTTVREAIGGVDALIVSDYAKGVLPRDRIRSHIEAAREAGIPVIVDPKSGDFTAYRFADVVTPNAAEAAAATGHDCSTDAGASDAAKTILRIGSVGAVVITRGGQGMTVLAPQSGIDEALHIPATEASAVETSGAGDTVVATLALALAAGVDIEGAARLANTAAGIAASKPGTAAVTADELRRALPGPHHPAVTRSEAFDQVQRWRREGLTIGFANGCFDLVHPGHVALLSRARQQCDRLIVALNTDASVRRIKGPNRPVQNESARAAVIGSLRSVDLVTTFDEDTPLELIALLRPDVLIKGSDYRIEEVVGADIVGQWGGRVHLVPVASGHSTSSIISRTRSDQCNEPTCI
jgi:D-beta-D-heptose 7-phosphate kinase/D-beta-D-heptose 1-phosphate adenosyltransferase